MPASVPSPSRRAAGARRAVRAALPLTLASGLVAGALVAAGGSAADAAAQTGTYTIGDVPIPLNQATDPGIGVLTPSADAAVNGMFGPQESWPVIPLHVALARDGSLISYGTPLGSNTQGGMVYDKWNPAGGFGADAHSQTTSNGQYNGFCDSIAVQPDGTMLMVGGNSDMSSMLYDPVTGASSMGSALSEHRWYGTTMRLTDGRMLVLGGVLAYDSSAYLTPDDNSQVGTVPEIGTGAGGFTQLTGAASTDFFGANDNHWWYPRVFNGPNGTAVGFSGDEIWSLDPTGSGSVRRIGTLPFNPLVSGSQVMYEPGKVLVAGGGQHINSEDVPATNAAAVFDVATGEAHSVSAMHFPRNWLNLTTLPTGSVWANGGTTVGMGEDDLAAQSVKQSEIWDPTTGQWSLAATAQRTRTYHSVAVLLPSGAVFTGGGGAPGPEDNLNEEMYYPSYLFTKSADGQVSWAQRPAITAISGSATYGGSIRMKVDGDISFASLITTPVETHAQNVDQRRIPLTVTRDGDSVVATLPTSAADMPAGDYELSVVNSAGVPSTAQVVTIRTGQPGLVTVAAAATATPTSGGQGAGTGASGGATTGTPVGQGEGTAVPGSVAIKLDEAVGIESTDANGSRIALSGSTARLQAVTAGSGAALRAQTTWILRTGLASSSGWSLESADEPGTYLETGPGVGGALRAARYSPSRDFATRATFALGLGATGQNTSLRAWADRSYWVRHVGNSLVLQHLDTSAKGRWQSTFSIRAGYVAAPGVWLTNGKAVGLQSVGRAGSLVRELGTHVSLQQIGATSSWTLKNDATWIVHVSRAGLSFESRDQRGWYLAASSYGTGAIVLARYSASAAFTARSTFSVAPGAAGHDRTLRLAAHPAQVLTQSGSALLLRPLGAGAAAKAAATFVVHTGLVPRSAG